MKGDIYTFPKPASNNFREVYEIKNLAGYEAPNTKEINFILETVRVEGGQDTQTYEYPFFGRWNNIAINEKVHSIKVAGFLRGDKYIAERQNIINAFRVETNDDNAGYLFLPLWGRFKVVLLSWSIDESANENGQCKIEATFNRAGKSEKTQTETSLPSVTDSAENLKDKAKKSLVKNTKNNFNANSFISSFTKATSKLSLAISKVQGSAGIINNMARAINNVSSLIAQGVKTPAVLADAFSNVCESIANSVITIKQSSKESKDSFNSLLGNAESHADTTKEYDTGRNEKRTILEFIQNKDVSFIAKSYISKDEIRTAKESENFVKLMSLYIVALILAETDGTKNTLKNYLSLYDSLHESIDKNDYEIYDTCLKLRLSLVETLKNKNAKTEKMVTLAKNENILVLEKYLSCERQRELNFIEDSFCLPKNIVYV